MELYEAFISSVPAHLRVTMAVRGRYQAYVETEGGAGLASLPLPGKKPYGDAAVCTDWLGKPLRDLAAQLGSDDMALSALGCAAVRRAGQIIEELLPDVRMLPALAAALGAGQYPVKTPGHGTMNCMAKWLDAEKQTAPIWLAFDFD